MGRYTISAAAIHSHQVAEEVVVAHNRDFTLHITVDNKKVKNLVKNRYLQEKYFSVSHFIKASNWFGIPSFILKL